MGRQIQTKIKENLDVLENCLAQANDPRIKERLTILMAIKNNKDLSQRKLAKEIGIKVTKLRYWINVYHEAGLDGFTQINNVNDNRKSLITPIIHQDLAQRAQDKENPLTSYNPLIPYLKAKYDLDIGYPTLSSYMIRHFGPMRKKKNKRRK